MCIVQLVLIWYIESPSYNCQIDWHQVYGDIWQFVVQEFRPLYQNGRRPNSRAKTSCFGVSPLTIGTFLTRCTPCYYWQAHRQCTRLTAAVVVSADCYLCEDSEPRSVLIERRRDGGPISCWWWWDCLTLVTCFCWPLSSVLNSWFACSLKCSSNAQKALYRHHHCLRQIY